MASTRFSTEPFAAPLKLLLFGATGAVGIQVLAAALADARVAEVIAPTRRPLASQAKLLNPVMDFSRLAGDESWWRADAVICALGTTIKIAGSQSVFAAIDRDLPISVAKNARQAGATRFGLNSSLGASLTGNFYLRTKAEAEAGIRSVGYPQLVIVRPSLIDAKRPEPRLGEQVGLVIARILRPLVPRRYRPVSAQRIAHALLEGVLSHHPGERIIESEALQD